MSEMLAYMEVYRIEDVEDRDRFIKMMKALDRVYIKYMNAKLKQERESRQKKAKAARPRRGRR